MEILTSIHGRRVGLGSDGNLYAEQADGTLQKVNLDAADVDDPGDDATALGADKVLKITLGGDDFWIPLLDNNDTAG
jgi:hypothetical protein